MSIYLLNIGYTAKNLTEDERKIYESLSRTMLKSISGMAPYVEFGKSKTALLLKKMGKMRGYNL